MKPWLPSLALLLTASAAAVLAAPDIAPRPGSVAALSNMPMARAAHSASLLKDGRVLIAGGCIATGCEEGITNTALLFNPKTERFSSTGSLREARVGHREVPLLDGSILIIGGWARDGATANIERFDPATGRFSIHGQLLEARDGFSATPLRDGTILIAGGYAGAMQRKASAEIYDPRTRRSTAINDMDSPRMAHTATLLPDGRVLIAGGSSRRGSLSDTIEIFDPATRTFSNAGRLHRARHKHAAIRIGDDVLIIGGAGVDEYTAQFSDTELWRNDSKRTQPGPSMGDGRYKFLDSVVALGDGTALVAGSGRVPERLRTSSMKFESVRGDLGSEFSFTTATRLTDGRVLLVGGYDPHVQVTRKAWLFNP